jgi:hypothetical protein
MLSLTLFVAGIAVTFLVGAPLVARFASPDSWREWQRIAPSDGTAPQKTHATTAFAPLDLGPDRTLWPSQRPWPASRIPEADWPSRSWNDEHFGTHWRKAAAAAGKVVAAAGKAVAAAGKPPAPARPAATEAAAEESWFEGAPSPAEPEPQPAPRRRPGPPLSEATEQIARAQLAAQKASSAAGGIARGAAKAAPKVAKVSKQAAQAAAKVEQGAKQAQKAADGVAAAAKAASATLAGAPPSRDEIRRLVDEFGLAGAVKEVMNRTGWDFRTAAQYLAQHKQ